MRQPLHGRASSARCRRRSPSTCARPSRIGQRLQAEAHPLRAPADPAAAPPRSWPRRKEEFARLITAESGPLPEGLALRGRPRLRRLRPSPAQLTIKDDGEIYSCDITPHGKQRKIYTTRPPLLGVHLGDHAVQPSAQHGEPQARAGDRHQQPRGAEADRADAADRAARSPTCSTRRACRRRCCRSSPAIRRRWATP